MDKINYIESRFVSDINERKILKSFEISEEISAKLIEEIDEDCLFVSNNKKLFIIYKDLILNGKNIKEYSILSTISSNPSLIVLYNSLKKEEVSIEDLPKYIQTIKDKLQYRRLQSIHRDLGNKIENNVEPNPQLIIDDLHKNLISLSSENSEEDPAISSILKKIIPDLENIQPIKSNLLGIPSGIQSLDALTLGWQSSHLTILAGLTSVGKTEFAIQMAAHCARVYRSSVVIFSMEMTKEEMTERMLSALSGVNYNLIRLKRFNDEQKRNVGEAYRILDECPIFLYDDSMMTIAKISSKLIQLRTKIQKNIDLVIIDYLQLVVGTGQNRVQEVAGISRGLKAISKKEKVPVIALSQFSRLIDQRGDSWKVPPKLSDLRESGTIEQDADEVICLTAEPYIDPETGFVLTKRQTMLWLLKNRHGPTGCVDLINHCELQKFEEIVDKYEYQTNRSSNKDELEF